jgi:hypothetical protein
MLENLFGTDESDDPNNPAGLTKITRQVPNGRLTEADPDPTEFGVDRQASGRFASKQRAPVPVLREDDGEFELDPYAVGNFDAPGEENKRR